MMRSLYSLSIYSYIFYIRLGSLFNKKAKLMIAGRKNEFEKLSQKVPELRSPGSELIWFHCASLGEFEQGRPVMEKLKALKPSVKILLTFFSPSGFEVRKNYPGADFICYLPMDTPSNAKKFLELAAPEKAFFVKYEFWFNYLNELNKKKIPTYLVSGIFREDHHFFKATGGWFRRQLTAFTHFFLQDENSMRLLKSIGYNNATLAGDTRFDRVADTAKNVKQIELVKIFSEGNKVMIGGSTWAPDEELLAASNILNSGYKLIIAPHEIDDNHIGEIESLFKRNGNCVRYSTASADSIKTATVLIIDNIGLLSSLYQYGSIAFVGGGFGKGIHNTLEAATFGMPVIFGPNYQKFAEAKDLIKLGGAFSVYGNSEFETTMNLLSDDQVLKTSAQISRMYVQGKTGASEKILAATFPG